VEEAHGLLEEAQAEIDAMGSSFSGPEVRRLRAELLVAAASSREEALADLCDAARDAEEKGATVFRDRALASAARLQGGGATGRERP
jgi:hypothetical protein